MGLSSLNTFGLLLSGGQDAGTGRARGALLVMVVAAADVRRDAVAATVPVPQRLQPLHHCGSWPSCSPPGKRLQPRRAKIGRASCRERVCQYV